MEKFRWRINSRDPLNTEPELTGFSSSLGECLLDAIENAWVYDTIVVDSGHTASDGEFEVVEEILELFVSKEVKKGKF